MTKTCGECKHFNGVAYCLYRKGGTWGGNMGCGDFADKDKLTNGDKIIAGGMRVIAECMVYGYRETDDNGQVIGDMLYTWKRPQAKVFNEYNEAVDYLEAWLNAPAESEDIIE